MCSDLSAFSYVSALAYTEHRLRQIRLRNTRISILHYRRGADLGSLHYPAPSISDEDSTGVDSRPAPACSAMNCQVAIWSKRMSKTRCDGAEPSARSMHEWHAGGERHIEPDDALQGFGRLGCVLTASSASASKIGAPIPLAQPPAAIALSRFMGDERRRARPKKTACATTQLGPPAGWKGDPLDFLAEHDKAKQNHPGAIALHRERSDPRPPARHRGIDSRRRAPGVNTAFGAASAHQLDQMRTRWPRLERIAEVLRLPRNVSVAEFHDAHRVRGHPVVSEHEFRDP
jgi:hypothetical protein